jgi:hypothetical protein
MATECQLASTSAYERVYELCCIRVRYPPFAYCIQVKQVVVISLCHLEPLLTRGAETAWGAIICLPLSIRGDLVAPAYEFTYYTRPDSSY